MTGSGLSSGAGAVVINAEEQRERRKRRGREEERKRGREEERRGF